MNERDVWAADLTRDEVLRLADALRRADYMNWSALEIAERVAGTVRAIAAARRDRIVAAALAYRNLVFGGAHESDQLEAWAVLDSLFLEQGEPYPAEAVR